MKTVCFRSLWQKEKIISRFQLTSSVQNFKNLELNFFQPIYPTIGPTDVRFRTRLYLLLLVWRRLFVTFIWFTKCVIVVKLISNKGKWVIASPCVRLFPLFLCVPSFINYETLLLTWFKVRFGEVFWKSPCVTKPGLRVVVPVLHHFRPGPSRKVYTRSKISICSSYKWFRNAASNSAFS